MELYFNCYVIGQGYSLRRIHRKNEDVGDLETIRLKDLPEHLVPCFIQGSTGLCLDSMGDVWFGCARNIPAYLKDEAGRNCFLNLALTAEPGDAGEAEAVRALMVFARNHKDAFAVYMSRVVYYPSLEYAIDMNAWNALITAAIAEEGGKTEPFSCAEGDWASTAPDRNVFFYCSTPSMGYTLRKIEPSTGLAYRFGEQKGMTVVSQLLPYERKLLDNGGASMALFEQNGRFCFITKGVKIPGQANANAKKLSLLIDVPVSNKAWLTRLACYALFSPVSFAQLLTDCIEVYPGPAGFKVLPDRLETLFSVADHMYRLPDRADGESKRLWKQINRPQQSDLFRFVVLETTYEYFEKFCGISISASDSTALISYQQAEKLTKQAMELIPDEDDAGKTNDDFCLEQAQNPSDLKKTNIADDEETPAKIGEHLPDARVCAEKKAKPKADVHKEAEVQEELEQEEDKINLLDYKWFLPCAIAGLLLVIVAIVLFILLKKNQGGTP